MISGKKRKGTIVGNSQGKRNNLFGMPTTGRKLDQIVVFPAPEILQRDESQTRLPYLKEVKG